jgi:hypothetical protein
VLKSTHRLTQLLNGRKCNSYYSTGPILRIFDLLPITMPSRFFSNRDAEEQQLPFTGDTVNDGDFASDQSQIENGTTNTVPRSRPIRAQSITSQTLSASFSRNPVRSFAHQTSHGFAGMTPPHHDSNWLPYGY